MNREEEREEEREAEHRLLITQPRQALIKKIEALYPADSPEVLARSVGARLLNEARIKYSLDWRHEPTRVLQLYAELCEATALKAQRIFREEILAMSAFMTDQEAIDAVRQGRRAITRLSVLSHAHPDLVPHCEHSWHVIACDNFADLHECKECGLQRLSPVDDYERFEGP